jgi:hypothetical protein
VVVWPGGALTGPPAEVAAGLDRLGGDGPDELDRGAVWAIRQFLADPAAHDGAVWSATGHRPGPAPPLATGSAAPPTSPGPTNQSGPHTHPSASRPGALTPVPPVPLPDPSPQPTPARAA